jgi:hypothetical protein
LAFCFGHGRSLSRAQHGKRYPLVSLRLVCHWPMWDCVYNTTTPHTLDSTVLLYCRLRLHCTSVIYQTSITFWCPFFDIEARGAPGTTWQATSAGFHTGYSTAGPPGTGVPEGKDYVAPPVEPYSPAYHDRYAWREYFCSAVLNFCFGNTRSV